MLTLDGQKVLIDAPIRQGIEPYATSSLEERQRLERATAPYDDVSAILVTHWHEDHFERGGHRRTLEAQPPCRPGVVA